jgi:hypothetical protein
LALTRPDNVVTPVPPLATGRVPVTPVDRGKPVAFVRVAALGVPRSGVTSAGLVAKTRAPVPVVVEAETPPTVKLWATIELALIDTGITAPMFVPLIEPPWITGEVRIGLSDSTTEPDPVAVVLPVPPYMIGSVPPIMAPPTA